MGLKKKDDARYDADFIAAYGILPQPIDYADFCGLYWNIPRVRLQRALQVTRGMGILHSLDDLPDEWFDADALDSAQVEDLKFETNAERLEARVMNRGKNPH